MTHDPEANTTRDAREANRRAYVDFILLAQAGAPLVQLVSHEEERVEDWCAALCEPGMLDEAPAALFVWNLADGLRLHYVPDGVRRDEPTIESAQDPIEVLAWLREQQEPTVLLVQDLHPLVDGAQGQGGDPHLVRHLRSTARQLRDARLAGAPARVVVLLDPVPCRAPELSQVLPIVDVPLPDRGDLKVVAEEVTEQLDVPLTADEALLEAARGLTIDEARLAFGRVAVAEGELSARQAAAVSAYKEQLLRQSEVLEYFEPEARLSDVAGLDVLKRWLEKRGRAFGVEARRFGLEPPRGVLLLGVQGCGKSLLAKAIAAQWRWPLLRLDPGKAFGSLLGESEDRIRQALKTAEALAPCVLWLDELEKGLAGMGSSDRTDGGTAARLVGTLLTWMQERRAPVFVVATANRIDLLPPELLRKGRFDELFFVDLPAPEERRAIFEVHLRKRDRDPRHFALDRLVEASRGFSGAEIEEAVKEALFEAFDAGAEVKDEHLLDALAAARPLARTMAEDLEALRRWAAARTRRASSVTPEKLDLGQARKTPRLPQERMFRPPTAGRRESSRSSGNGAGGSTGTEE